MNTPTTYEIEKVVKSIDQKAIKTGNEWKLKCPFHNDTNPSMYVNVETGAYFCHGCKAKGNVKQLSDLVHDKNNTQSLPQVKDKPKAKRVFDKNKINQIPQNINGFELKEKYAFCNADGTLSFVDVRYENETGKTFRPFHESINEKVTMGLPDNKNLPLRNLPEIIKNPDLIVMLTEGVKAELAAKAHLKKLNIEGVIVSTWVGGSNAVHKTDLTPLGKVLALYLMPDNDDTGIKAMESIAKEVEKLGCKKIYLIKPRSNGVKGEDAADIDSDTFKQMFDCAELYNVDKKTAFEPELIPPSPISFELSKTEQVKSILSQSLKFRYNVITGGYQFCYNDQNNWIDFNDRHFNTIRSAITSSYIKSLTESDLRMVIESDFTPEYNPVQDYIEHLPKWDKQTDYIQQLANFVKVLPGQFGENIDSNDIWYTYLSRWLVASIAQMLHEHENHTCLTLLGPQGLGKTTYLRNLGIDEELTYVGEINPGDKDSKILYVEKTLIVLDELEATTKHDLSKIKSNMTLKQIDVRRPYARKSQKLKRLVSFCANANDIHVLGDLTGSRRWLCVEIETVNYQEVTPTLMQNVYSQALSMFNDGYRYWFNHDEIIYLDKRNERFYSPCHEEEALLSLIYTPEQAQKMTGEPIQVLTNTELMGRLSNKYPSIRFGSKKLGQILRKYNFVRKCRSEDHMQGYEVILK